MKEIINFIDNDNIENDLKELETYLNQNVNIRFKVKYEGCFLGKYVIKIYADIYPYCVKTSIGFNTRSYLPIKAIIESIKYHIFEDIVNNLKLNKLGEEYE